MIRFVAPVSMLLFFITSCGEPSNYHYVKENNELDIKKAEKIATEFYEKLLSKDSLKIKSCFDVAISNDVAEFIDMLKARDEEWGKFHSFSIGGITTRNVQSKKGDTLIFQVEINAVYDDNQSWDDLTIKKINNGKFKIVDYDFDPDQMLNCATDELDWLIPVYEDYSWAIANNDTAQINELCFGDSKFYKDVLFLQNEYFPPGTKCDSIVYHDSHLRKYCGKNTQREDP